MLKLVQVDLGEPILIPGQTAADVFQLEGLLWTQMHDYWFHWRNCPSWLLTSVKEALHPVMRYCHCTGCVHSSTRWLLTTRKFKHSLEGVVLILMGVSPLFSPKKHGTRTGWVADDLTMELVVLVYMVPVPFINIKLGILFLQNILRLL